MFNGRASCQTIVLFLFPFPGGTFVGDSTPRWWLCHADADDL